MPRDEERHTVFGKGEEAERYARRFARSATRQARFGVRYVARLVRDEWTVIRISHERGER